MAPKGSAFLYARRQHHAWMNPLIVSWGYEAEATFSTGSRFIDYFEWLGTRDLAPFLATPAAIEFQSEFAWDAVRDRCHQLTCEIRRRVNDLTGLEPICPETSKWFGQMSAIRLPELDTEVLQDQLRKNYRIEVPVLRWQGIPLIRVSVQGYNDQRDVDALIAALKDLLV
jgi:isopenicillin-N epimerase